MSDGENTGLSIHEAHDVFENYEMADEQQIIEEMSGRVTDKYVYTFKQGGQDVTGLSFAGTNWAVREYAKQGEVIRIVGRPEIIVDPTDPDYIVVVITAQRFVLNRETGKEIALDSTIGVKRQGKFMEKKKYGADGEVTGYEKTVDPFYVEKAVSKAIRNAKQALIPTDIVKKLISRALDSRAGKNVQGKAQTRPPQQPPVQPTVQPVQQAKPVQPPAQPQTPAPQSRPAQAAVATPPAQPTAQPVAQPVASQPATPVSAPAQAQPAVVSQPVVTQPAVVQQPAAQPVTAPVAPAVSANVQPAAPAPSQAAEPNKDVLVQKLDAVLKAVFATQDTALARQGLLRLTGFASPADMPADQIKSLGNVLNGVVKKFNKVEVNQVIRVQDNVVVWQGPQLAAPVSSATDPLF